MAALNTTRRHFIKTIAGMTILPSALLSSSVLASAAEQKAINLSLLHVEPQLGRLDANCDLIEKAMRQAAAAGSEWVITPELCLTGYRFDTEMGLGWMTNGPDQWVKRLQKVAEELRVVLFLSHVEQLSITGDRYNTLFVIDRQGEIIARHKKINTIPVSEGWSQPGEEPTVVSIDGLQVGLLICADTWPKKHAQTLQRKNADLIVSSANWAPGEYGPKNTWKKRSLETGLPLFVCNRTGVEKTLNMIGAKSVIAYNGQHLLEHYARESTIVLVEWNHNENKINNFAFIKLT